MKSLLQRLGNPLEWNAVDKGILICGLVIPLYLFYIVYTLAWLRLMPDGELLDPVQAMHHVRSLALFSALALSVVLFGFWLRTRRPASVLYQHLATQVFAISLSVVGYRVGAMSIVVGIAIAGLPLVGYMLFPRGVVIAAVTSGAVIIFGSAFLSALNVLPYAPVLSPAVDGERSLAWVATMTLLFVVPVWGAIAALGIYVIHQWRAREQEVKLLSVTDPLTGVANRRRIMSELEQEVMRSRRDRLDLAVIMVDLDHFKRINDQYGHHTGDKVLKSAASILNEAIRKTDTLGRFGGEEFMILLPNTGLPAARDVAERCRSLLNDVRIAVDGRSFSVSASLGVAAWGDWDHPIGGDTLLQRADEALYRAKEEGRNQVVVAGACQV